MPTMTGRSRFSALESIKSSMWRSVNKTALAAKSCLSPRDSRSKMRAMSLPNGPLPNLWKGSDSTISGYMFFTYLLAMSMHRSGRRRSCTAKAAFAPLA